MREGGEEDSYMDFVLEGSEGHLLLGGDLGGQGGEVYDRGRDTGCHGGCLQLRRVKVVISVNYQDYSISHAQTF